MFQIIIGGAVLSLISAPAYIYLWKVAAEKRENSLQKAHAVAQRRRFQNPQR